MNNDDVNKTTEIAAETTASNAANAVQTGVNDGVRTGDFIGSVELVIARCAKWNANERKTSDYALYGLLADCFALYERVRKSRTLQERLTAYLNEKNIAVGANSSGLGKLVKAVFGSSEQYLNAYIGALRIAAKNNIKAGEVKDWLIENNGVSGVRKKYAAKQATAVARADEVKRGSTTMLKRKAICTIANAAAELEQDDDDDADFAIALLRKDGADMSVVHVWRKQSSVAALLRRIGAKVSADGTADVAVNAATEDTVAADAALLAELEQLAA